MKENERKKMKAINKRNRKPNTIKKTASNGNETKKLRKNKGKKS